MWCPHKIVCVWGVELKTYWQIQCGQMLIYQTIAPQALFIVDIFTKRDIWPVIFRFIYYQFVFYDKVWVPSVNAVLAG